jgi:acyl-CoA synthetase (AMP-forming)/AMP-acid ligase II
MTNNKSICGEYDLGSVTSIFTGAAPLGSETAIALQKQYPSWAIRQAYGKQCNAPSFPYRRIGAERGFPGLTETATMVCGTIPDDIHLGSSGPLLPAVEARIVDARGNDITGYDQRGELWIRSPSVALGYRGNEEATRETFAGGWMRTGDEVLVRKSPKGNEHIWIVDRIKELIKVKGHQVGFLVPVA